MKDSVIKEWGSRNFILFCGSSPNQLLMSTCPSKADLPMT
jgi:hypothetical protein